MVSLLVLDDAAGERAIQSQSQKKSLIRIFGFDRMGEDAIEGSA